MKDLSRKSNKLIIAPVGIVAIIVVVVVLIISTGISTSTPMSTSSASKTVYFTIIESDTGALKGMNGSAYHVSEAWPVITVKQGEAVVIYLLNRNSSEAHGFEISHYFNQGVALEPGGSYKIQFVANEPGTFLITCPIFCLIHPLMDFGQFVVLSNSTS
jgi:FtsP/CotA-like multicopper oxidase with cupredoxin domain